MATATITSDKNAVVAEILIAAPPARVFQAISDPAQPATSEAKRKGWKCLPEWHQSALTFHRSLQEDPWPTKSLAANFSKVSD
jgi:uncharacterized protein YndB with AHSA1/START domain